MFIFFFFTDTATTEIYTLSLHDALPIWFTTTRRSTASSDFGRRVWMRRNGFAVNSPSSTARSEEHTSELQSRRDLVCRLLLEKKKKNHTTKNRVTNRRNAFLTRSQTTND